MIEKMDEKTNNWEFIDEYTFDEPLSGEGLSLNVPTGKNQVLRILKDRVEKDLELATLWKCSNVIAVNRLGYSDHGKKHVEIMANSALRILRLISESGVQPSCIRDYGLTYEDAEAIVFMGACLPT